jgi:amino acid permease
VSLLLAFTFQMNIYSIWDEQIDASVHNINYIAIISIAFVLTIYLIISMFGYITFFASVARMFLSIFYFYFFYLSSTSTSLIYLLFSCFDLTLS